MYRLLNTQLWPIDAYLIALYIYFLVSDLEIAIFYDLIASKGRRTRREARVRRPVVNLLAYYSSANIVTIEVTGLLRKIMNCCLSSRKHHLHISSSLTPTLYMNRN